MGDILTNHAEGSPLTKQLTMVFFGLFTLNFYTSSYICFCSFFLTINMSQQIFFSVYFGFFFFSLSVLIRSFF